MQAVSSLALSCVAHIDFSYFSSYKGALCDGQVYPRCHAPTLHTAPTPTYAPPIVAQGGLRPNTTQRVLDF